MRVLFPIVCVSFSPLSFPRFSSRPFRFSPVVLSVFFSVVLDVLSFACFPVVLSVFTLLFFA